MHSQLAYQVGVMRLNEMQQRSAHRRRLERAQARGAECNHSSSWISRLVTGSSSPLRLSHH